MLTPSLHHLSLRSRAHPPFAYYPSQSASPLFTPLNSSLPVFCFSLGSHLYSEVFNPHPLPYFSHSSIFTLSINLPRLITLLRLLRCLCCFFSFTGGTNIETVQLFSSDGEGEAQTNSGTSKHLFQSLPFLCSVVLCPQFTFRETLLSQVAATVADKKLAGCLAFGDYSLV